MRQDEKRQLIIQAAERMFSRRRFHEITLGEVAKDAKVGKGTIYLYFKDKDDLFLQTVLAGFDDLSEVLEQKVPRDAPFAERLHGACIEIAEFFKRRRLTYQLMQGADPRTFWGQSHVQDEWRARHERLVGVVADVLRQGARDGKIRDDIQPRVLVHFLLSMLKTTVWVLADNPEEEEFRIEMLIDLFCRGAGRVGPTSDLKGPAVSPSNNE